MARTPDPRPGPDARSAHALTVEAFAALADRALRAGDPEGLADRLVAAGLAEHCRDDGREMIAIAGQTGIGRDVPAALEDWRDRTWAALLRGEFG